MYLPTTVSPLSVVNRVVLSLEWAISSDFGTDSGDDITEGLTDMMLYAWCCMSYPCAYRCTCWSRRKDQWGSPYRLSRVGKRMGKQRAWRVS